MVKVKKIEKNVRFKCYKCHKNLASWFLSRERELSQGRWQATDIPLCNVCLSAWLNYLDDQLIKWAYDKAHEEEV